MDRIKETSDLILAFNKFRNGSLEDFLFIKDVCNYFDIIKNENISKNDYRFLKYIANCSGIPHFYYILDKFGNRPDLEVYDLNTFSSLFYESSLHTDNINLLHKFQKEILDMFEFEKQNKFFLSASTSFGKTHLVFEVIKKMKYGNVVLIFPTIALLSENYEKLVSNTNYSYFNDFYTIHTLSEVNVDSIGDNNLFIYTPERFLSFIENTKLNIQFNFAFVDEAYKIDNDYFIDDELKENERDLAYRLAVHYLLKFNSDILLAGPYIDFCSTNPEKENDSFNNFLIENNISLINYNNYEIVNKSILKVNKLKIDFFDNQLKVKYSENSKSKMLIETIVPILNISQNIIVYCANRSGIGGVEYYANYIIESKIISNHSYNDYLDIISHISNNFSSEWILVKALKCGIGIHHGLVPKYIQKEIIELFNKGKLPILISTTTITEGVNTSAKNVVVMHSKKGDKILKKFDAKNIAGRAGRFGYHYSGRVIDLSGKFVDIINSDSEVIKHKNYDINSPKDEIDIFYSDDKYLSHNDKIRKEQIELELQIRNIPEKIINQYKVISKVDKVYIFDQISKLNDNDLYLIKKLIDVINYRLDVHYEGFQIVLDILCPIIKNKNLKFLIEYRGKNNSDFSMLTNLIHFYLIGGFESSVKYFHNNRNCSIDDSIRKTSEFVYNTLKYHVVKYLGVFNIMYKYFISINSSTKFDDIIGLDRLLLKFEYNALTNEVRIASDYGVPSNVIRYYENHDRQFEISLGFDNYELVTFFKIDKIISRH